MRTMIKLFFGAAIILFTFSFIYNISGGAHDIAMKNANQYISHMDSTTTVSCNKYDSDGNGYLTCTIFRRNGDPLEIECGYAGCRIPKKIVGVR